MLDFNSRNIIVGYIKQLLYTFNLPCCKVFKNESECDTYFTSTTRNIIKYNNNIIVIIKKYKDGKDYFVSVDLSNNKKTIIAQYRYNHPYINLTKTLKLQNNIYDDYTHRYLGNYLRFIRDYFDINLMSLYNCYDNTSEVINDYKYYTIPVKYNKEYTLFYEAKGIQKFPYIFTTNLKNLESQFISTEKNKVDVNILNKKNKLQTVITTPQAQTTRELFDENNLKMVIKVPLLNEFPLVILEGNYSGYNTTEELYNPGTKGVKKQNWLCINYEKDDNDNYINEKDYYTEFKDNIKTYNFQLVNTLKLSKNNYPFSDRLIEYLIGNVITDLDPISKNIIDAKKKLQYRYLAKDKADIKKQRGTFTIMDRFKMLDAIHKNKKALINREDLLGYVDKDVESVLDDERYKLSEEVK